jgi:hypothetical protein
MMKGKSVTDSLTPWDYEPENSDRPLPPKRLPHTSQQHSLHRYNSEGTRMRIRTSQKSRAGARDVIRLQERAPTEAAMVPDWQVEIKAMGFLRSELVIKIPNQFVTLPPKRTPDPLRRPTQSLSRNQAAPAIREKVSFRNFKKEIEELDRLRTGSRSRFDLLNPSTSKGVLKISDPSQTRSSFQSSKRCSLKNMNPFDEQPAFKAQREPAKTRGGQEEVRKKHVLDLLLSKF